MLLSDFNKVMPLLKNGFFVKWLNTNEQNGWHSYETFAERFDFKKIQIIECKKHFSYDEDFDFELVLRKI